ncbi:MAG TPA: hypothetical protein VHA56_21970 [Mucilaginibacter sp.]|nr:hypothetical protein [Mucilaginibacter sp.]
MKKFKKPFVALLFACTLFAISPVKADPGLPAGGADPDDASGLPISNDIWVLVTAAALIGTTTILYKTKAGKSPVTE